VSEFFELLLCLTHCRAISNLYYMMVKFGIRDRGETRSTTTFDQLEKVSTVIIL